MNSNLSHKIADYLCPECGSNDIEYSNETTCRKCGIVFDSEPQFLNIPDRNQACQQIQFKRDTFHGIGNQSERRNTKFERLSKLNSQIIQNIKFTNEQIAYNNFKFLFEQFAEKKYFTIEELINLFNYVYAQLTPKSRCRNPDVIALLVFEKAHEYLNIYLTPMDPSTKKLFFNVSISVYHRICLEMRTKIFQYLDTKFKKTRSQYFCTKKFFRLDDADLESFRSNLAKYVHLDDSFYRFISSVLIRNKHRSEFGKKVLHRLAICSGIVLYKLGLLPKYVHLNYLAKTAHLNQDNLTKKVYTLAEGTITKQFDVWAEENQEKIDLWSKSFKRLHQYNRRQPKIMDPEAKINITSNTIGQPEVVQIAHNESSVMASNDLLFTVDPVLMMSYANVNHNTPLISEQFHSIAYPSFVNYDLSIITGDQLDQRGFFDMNQKLGDLSQIYTDKFDKSPPWI